MQIADKVATADTTREGVQSLSGNQTGYPVHMVEISFGTVGSPNPTQHLLLGNDVIDGGMAKLAKLRINLADWDMMARGADSQKAVQGKAV